jgi:hypothetical protein
MKLELTDQMKVNTLHTLIEEYGRQVQWVKDLDFKIIYYTLAFLVAIIAWFIANPQEQAYIFIWIIAFLCVWSIIFLFRNHFRHGVLLDKLRSVHEALGFFEPKLYAEEALEGRKNFKDWAFHAGRILYAFGIVCAGLFSAIVLIYN